MATVPLIGFDPLTAVGANYADLWRRVRRARGWRNRLGVLLRSPAWRPAGDEAPATVAPPPAVRVTRAQGSVALALFLVSTACTGGLLWRIDDLGRGALAGIAASLVAGLWAIGAVLDRRLPPRPAAVMGALAAGVAFALLFLA